MEICMKIALVSDLHLEFGYTELPGDADVLILGGDIAEARSIGNDFHSTKLLSAEPNQAFRCSEFFKWECAKYDKVFYVMGNHEHYHGRYDKTYETLKYMMPKNVTLLENEAVEYNGVMFMGATLWTELGKGDPMTELHVKQSMNDYHCIKMHNKAKDVYHKLSPAYTKFVHHETLRYFQKTLNEHPDKKFVVMTHHAPSWQSVHEYYKRDRLMNGGYVSDLDHFILQNTNIAAWTHGHVHNPWDYKIGDTRILCNPRGYAGYEDGNGFSVDFKFEV
jgi:Icc-related predicted phosphoesterase